MAKQIEESKKPTCFVIMPFSDPEGYEDGHFGNVYKYTFKPAIEAAGYTPLRIDENTVSNLIHSKMMDELVNAPMVLCDLSTNNPNVLYELGIRHAFDKPVVLVQEYNQKRIFDIGSITIVPYHRTRLFEETVADQALITDAIIQTAAAKANYSVMSMVALQSAQPIDEGSISAEEQTAFLLQQMMQKINNLETQMKASQETQQKQYYGAALYEVLNRSTDQDGSKPYVVLYDKDGKKSYVLGDYSKQNGMDLFYDNLMKTSKKARFKQDKKFTSVQTPVGSDEEM